MNRFISITICLLFAAVSFSQNEMDTVPPYKKNPNFPVVRLTLPDSSFFTKGDLDKKSAVMVMLFNPQCEHCQHETEELIKNIDKFKKIQIVMATSMPFDSMLHFRERYELAKYKNIIVSQDPNFTLISFFSIHSLPSLAFYNREKQFISLFEGGLHVDKILEQFGKKD